MKKDRKKNKLIEEEKIDISILKSNDLEDTATFTDLMTRKERKKHKKDKDIELTKEIEPKNVEDSMEFETEDLASQIAENKTVEISDEEIKEIVNTDLDKTKDEIEDDFEDEVKKENKNIFNTTFISIIIIALISLFVYAIIYTKILEKDLYLKIDGIALIYLVFNYCLMTITRKKAALFFTIINYLTIAAIIAFNSLIFFKII